jgi:hypothetical protein
MLLRKPLTEQGGLRRRDTKRWRGTAEKLGEPPQVLRGCREQHFGPAHNPWALMRYCVRNLYVTIRATMLAKISSARRDFRIIGLVEWRAADRPD